MAKAILNTHCEHRAIIPADYDDGEPINFIWKFQRGLLSPRMSGLELCEFVLHHMSGIIGQGLLAQHPRINREFHAMMVLLATSPKTLLDTLLPWIRVDYHTEDMDIIRMNLFDKTPQKSGPIYFT